VTQRTFAAVASSAALSFAVFTFADLAHAESRVPDNTWRHNDDKIPKKGPRRPMFAAEARFGPYWPNVDGEFGTDNGPYHKVFGSKPNFYFGLEFDFMPLRIPYVGMFGPGFGWGWTHSGAKAKLKGTSTASGEDTSLTIFPMHLSAVLRVDELMHRTGIPVVPYIKFGPAMAPWSAGTSAGTSVYGTTASGATCTSDTASQKGCSKGEGITWGLNLAVGGMLSLNWLDPRSAGMLYEDTAIAHIYLFGEWMDAMLNGLGSSKSLYVGSSTVVVGLAADF
jgi:hypothetical protein